MLIKEIVDEILINRNNIIKLTISEPNLNVVYNKIIIRAITLKGAEYWQLEQYKINQVFHLNLTSKEFEEYFIQDIGTDYKQICILLRDKNITYNIKKMV